MDFTQDWEPFPWYRQGRRISKKGECSEPPGPVAGLYRRCAANVNNVVDVQDQGAVPAALE